MKKRRFIQITFFLLLLYFVLRIMMVISTPIYLFFYKENLFVNLAWLDFLLLAPFLSLSFKMAEGNRMQQFIIFISYFPFIGLILLSVVHQSIDYGNLSTIRNDNRYILSLSNGHESDPMNKDNQIYKARLYEKKFAFIYKSIHQSTESISSKDSRELLRNEIQPIFLEEKGIIKFGDTVLYITK
ncbi:hypothetical protein [Bacillus sp. FJAT-42315]|uniref:hypothetical protein n=1 Tax=Bacillus sp. FJAT-42315 TaxID=2014077 RepID=UPI000C23B7C7|nr:hypothetical protein [Bacillus sp. FJAT-42315]